MREVTDRVTDEAEYDIVIIWMAFLVRSIKTEMMSGWKDSDICIILVAMSHHDARVFLCLYLRWKAACPQIQIFFESGSISQEWPLVFVCGN